MTASSQAPIGASMPSGPTVGAARLVLAATLREAASRRILLVGLIVSSVFVGIFTLGFVQADSEISQSPVSPAEAAAGLSILTVLGLYAVQFLTVFGATLLASGSVAGELESGRALAVLARPLSRRQWLVGRVAGFAVLVAGYSGLMVGGILLIARVVGGYGAIAPGRGFGLLLLEMMVVIALASAVATRLSPIPAGIVVLALYGVGWIAGIIEFVGTLLQNGAVVRIGVAVSLVVPTDAIWRGASYYLQSPVAAATSGSLEQVPFFGSGPPSAAHLVWTLAYLGGVVWLADRSLARRDL